MYIAFIIVHLLFKGSKKLLVSKPLVTSRLSVIYFLVVGRLQSRQITPSCLDRTGCARRWCFSSRTLFSLPPRAAGTSQSSPSSQSIRQLNLCLPDQGTHHVAIRQGGSVGNVFHGHFAVGLRLDVYIFGGFVVTRSAAHLSQGILYTHLFNWKLILEN